jgi:hypothetical protein
MVQELDFKMWHHAEVFADAAFAASFRSQSRSAQPERSSMRGGQGCAAAPMSSRLGPGVFEGSLTASSYAKVRRGWRATNRRQLLSRTQQALFLRAALGTHPASDRRPNQAGTL